MSRQSLSRRKAQALLQVERTTPLLPTSDTMSLGEDTLIFDKFRLASDMSVQGSGMAPTAILSASIAVICGCCSFLCCCSGWQTVSTRAGQTDESPSGSITVSKSDTSGVVKLQDSKHSVAAAVVCGLCTNFMFGFTLAASQDLAREFHSESHATLFAFTVDLVMFLSAIINAGCLQKFSFETRVQIAMALNVVACLGISQSVARGGIGGFASAVLFSGAAGGGLFTAEMSQLQFFCSFPPEILGGFGLGSGFGLVVAPAVFAGLRALGLSQRVVFLSVTPVVLLHHVAFQHLHHIASGSCHGSHLAKVLGGIPESPFSPRSPRHPAPAAPATLRNIKAALACGGDIIANFVVVYWMMYFVYPGLVDRETLCVGKQWFSIAFACYGVGTGVARFSIAVCQIEQVRLLSALQMLNVLGMLVEVFSGFIRNLAPSYGMEIVCAWMVWIGMVGGASYVNCLHLLAKRPDIPPELRELTTSVSFILTNIGTCLLNLAFVALDQSILADVKINPNGCDR